MSFESASVTAVEQIYPWKQAQPLFGGISRTTAWRMVRAGQLPKPVHISPNRVGWPHSAVAAWQAERVGGSPALAQVAA